MPGDISPGSGSSWFGANLTVFVENGTIAEARVDDMAERIIAAWYFLGQDDNYPEGGSCISISIADLCFSDSHTIRSRTVNFNAAMPLDPATNEHVDVQDRKSVV